MRKILKIVLLASLTSSGLCLKLHAQIPPNIDYNWQLNTNLSDEFNSTTLDNSKWCKLDNSGQPPCGGYNWGGNTNFQTNNVSLGTDGTKNVLMLRVDPPSINTSSPFVPLYPADTIHYTISQCCHTGGIQMIQGTNWSYGYIEISAKLPGFSVNGIGQANKFWPTFWSYNLYNCGNAHAGRDEIDAMDVCCSFYSDTKTTTAGWCHIDPATCTETDSPPATHVNDTPLCDNYHKIGAEWNTDRLIFYMDDIPWIYTNIQNLTLTPQRVLIEEQLDMNTNKDFSPGTIFPQYMRVDYFHYYKLRLDCSNPLTILNNLQLATYWTSGIPAVKSDITIGNGVSPISLNSGVCYVFRAVNSITINGDFSAPIGSELNIIPTPCN